MRLLSPATEDLDIPPSDDVLTEDDIIPPEPTNDVTFELTEPQSAVFQSKRRFRVLAAGRRFGKTTLACVELIDAAVSIPNSINWYVAPSYRQAKQIAWTKLKEMVPPEAREKTNETDLSFTLRGTSSIIALRGADNYDSLRGVGLEYVILDEIADMPSDAWNLVLRPALADKQGRALFIGTPKGFNFFYDLWLNGRYEEGWESFQYTTLQGGNVAASEIEQAMRTMPPYEFRQEFLASFESPSGRVYSEFDRDKHIREDIKDLGGTIFVGIDFNVVPAMHAVLGCRAGDQLHIFDEVVIPYGNTDLLGKKLRNSYPSRELWTFPDPSGKARKTSAAVGQTDFTILKTFKMRVIAPNKAPPVADRLNTVNSLFRSGRCFINTRCKRLLKSLDGLVYDENAQSGTIKIDKKSGLDHITDALGYLIWSEYPMVSRNFRDEEFLL